MIIDRYVRPANVCTSGISDPILNEFDWMLEDAELFRLVQKDLAKHYKHTKRGRRPVAVEVVLRLIVLRRLKRWSYRQMEQEVRDNPSYRVWARIYDQRVPDHTTLNDLERLIQVGTLHKINDRLLELAQVRGLTRGNKLRLDSTVTETNIRYPTDSGLLLDAVELLGRWLKCAEPLLSARMKASGVCCQHRRAARRRARQIALKNRSRAKRDPQIQAKKQATTQMYAELIQIARTTLEQANRTAEPLSKKKGDPVAEALVSELVKLRPLVENVVGQAERHILKDEKVPAQEKIVSLWEPHTQIICRGKPAPYQTEFGHKLNLAEIERGLVSDWQVVLKGNPPDNRMLPPLLQQHCQRFGHAPKTLAADRGLFSPDNEKLAAQAGVQEVVSPHTGKLTPERLRHEKEYWFKRGLHFRNGIEGRISVLKRTLQLRRCLAHGVDGFERWIGWGILVANMTIIARALHKRRHHRNHQKAHT